jgi:hypothetical protein
VQQVPQQNQVAPRQVQPTPQPQPMGQPQNPQRPSEAVIDGSAQSVPGGFHGAPQGQPVPDGQPAVDLLLELEEAIRAHVNPEAVAARLVEIFHTQQFQDALKASGGDIPELFNQRMGEAWGSDPANFAYIDALLTAVVAKGHAAGIFQDDDEAQEGQEDAG